MTELEEKIYQTIATSNGIKGSDIAAKLGIEKKVVNSILYSSNVLKALIQLNSATYKWHPLANVDTTSQKKTPVQPLPDKDLRNVCNYYLNCLSLESSSSVSQFLNSSYSLQYAVLNDLEIDPECDQSALTLLNKIRSNKEAKAYLGYPVRIFTVYGKGSKPYLKIAPIFLFPVEYSGGKSEINWIPSINMEILKGYNDSSADSLAVELVNLETELGMNAPDADIEADELVLRLRNIRQWDWAEPIDPYDIPEATDLSDFHTGIYNRPIIIEAEREKYTQGLEAELMTLANMPEENYRNTALYSWMKGHFGTNQVTNIRPVLEVLPLNSEQAQAVETALRSDLTIVTGPPGTGKSQVVTDLLINIAWNGKSALFSSKNNKAVDVVDVRVNGLCKRPVLLRIGSNQYSSRLAEIIEGLLNSRPNETDKADMEYYSQEYHRRVQELEQLKSAKDSIMKSRNALDVLEQKYCSIRTLIESRFDIIDAVDVGKIYNSALAFQCAFSRSIKENNGFFARLFWSSTSRKRFAERESTASVYNKYAEKYFLTKPLTDLTTDEVRQLADNARCFDNAMSVAVEYKRALGDLKNHETLESVDKKLTENKSGLADIAFKLWDKWLTTQAVMFSASERLEMSNFVAAMKLVGDVDLAQNLELKKQYAKMSQQMTKFLQCWAVTSLSAKSRVPFTAGVFDYVIIDEASQCDIASILPLLYRAKRAVIIGDPKQLSHISQLSKQQDLFLLQKYNVSPLWSYSANSLYALAAGKVNTEDIVQLKDHFRSCADIIDFSNEFFYEGSLRTATNYSALKTPANEKPGVRWINVSGKTVRPATGSAFNEKEVVAVVAELKRLIKVGYEGSIGVTTPFRKQAEEIKELLEQKEQELYEILLRKHEFIADTVHKFQGDERDLMIFSTVVTNGAPASSLGFLSSTGNLFNVAITRARSVLVIIGDYGFCNVCSVDYLKKFSDYYRRLAAGNTQYQSIINVPISRDFPWVANPEQVSEWEKVLYAFLYDAGIQTIPQYPIDKYKLDLAVMLDNDRKLDIEVDGAMYHRSWNGELCYRDQLRNQRLFELGWDVKRFWVYQIRDDPNWCVEQIKDWIQAAKKN